MLYFMGRGNITEPIQISLSKSIDATWLTTLAGKNRPRVLGTFIKESNLKKKGKIGLSQALKYANLFPLIHSVPNILFAPLQFSKHKIKLFLWRKKYWKGGICPPSPHHKIRPV